MSSPRKSKPKKRVSVSIVIPVYNEAKNLRPLLTNLVSLTPKGWEIIIVDDSSTDNTPAVAKMFPVRLRRLQKNQGPAKARNAGAKLARGEILVFFDADVLPFKNTLQEAVRPFRKNPQVSIVTGVCAKTQEKKSFPSEYKALRNWSYYFNEAETKGVYFFTPAVGAIKKDVFWKAGGFRTSFKKAGLESLDLSFRLQKIASIYFNPRFLVKHQFEGAWVQIKSYFKRTYFFLKLYSAYRQFPRVVATPKEALAVLLAASSFFVLVTGLFYRPILSFLPPILAFYLYRNSRFLTFFYSEKGFLFTAKAFFYNYLLHLVILTAGIFFFLTSPVSILKPRADGKT